jgi:hypothetical protein
LGGEVFFLLRFFEGAFFFGVFRGILCGGVRCCFNFLPYPESFAFAFAFVFAFPLIPIYLYVHVPILARRQVVGEPHVCGKLKAEGRRVFHRTGELNYMKETT